MKTLRTMKIIIIDIMIKLACTELIYMYRTYMQGTLEEKQVLDAQMCNLISFICLHLNLL